MPRTKFQEFFFTLITSGAMIYLMGVYNIAINHGGMLNVTLAMTVHTFPIEWLIGFICAFFIASRVSKHFAFKVAKATDRPIFKIAMIQTFTVCTMVPIMSMVGTIESNGLNIYTFPLWIQTIVLNFVMAYPLQILVVGPFCRFIFRKIFGKRLRQMAEEEAKAAAHAEVEKKRQQAAGSAQQAAAQAQQPVQQQPIQAATVEN